MGISSDPQPIYSATCDTCGECFEEGSEGWSQFLDKDHLLSEMSHAEWEITGDSKVLCEECLIKQRAAAEERGVAALQQATAKGMQAQTDAPATV